MDAHSSSESLHQRENRPSKSILPDLLASFANNLPVPLYVTNSTGKFIYANPSASRMLGYTFEEFLTKTPGDLGPEVDIKHWEEYRNHIKKHGFGVFRRKHITKAGRSIPVEVRVYDFKHGDDAYCLAIVSDATRLNNDCDLFKIFFDASNRGHVVFGDDGISQCNQSAITSLGYTDKMNLVGKHPADLSPKYQPDGTLSDKKALEVTAEAYEKGICQFPWTYLKKDGSLLSVIETLIPATINGRPFFLAEWTDISELKQAQDELSIIRERLEVAIEGSTLGLWDWVIDSNELYWSKRFCDILGLPGEEKIGDVDMFFDRLHPNDMQRLKSAVELHLESGIPYDVEYQIQHESGHYVWIHAKGLAQRDEDGRPIRMAGSVMDVTSRKMDQIAILNAQKETEILNSRLKNTLQSVKKMATEAEIANKTKSEFLANMSHEIRTPMNAVFGMAALLSDSNLTKEQADYVETIRSSSNALLTIINDILDFSKMESGMLQIESVGFDFLRCMEGAFDLFKTKAENKGINMRFDIDNDVPRNVLGDPMRVRQVIVNLLSNSLKFTNEGEVYLGITLLEKKEDRFKIQCVVRDTGVGIPKSKQGSLFEAFSQADSSTTRKYGGTGLGLTISKNLSEMMGGGLCFESEEGKGSTFYFVLPLQIDNKCILPENNRRLSDFKEGDLSVLLVEDNIVNQKVAKLLLQRIGYEPDLANNGLEALAAIEKKAYDLIFMDVHMPEMDGIEATRKIRAHARIEKQPKIIALTASAQASDRKNCKLAGMDDFLTKPIQVDELKRIFELAG